MLRAGKCAELIERRICISMEPGLSPLMAAHPEYTDYPEYPDYLDYPPEYRLTGNSNIWLKSPQLLTASKSCFSAEKLDQQDTDLFLGAVIHFQTFRPIKLPDPRICTFYRQ